MPDATPAEAPPPRHARSRRRALAGLLLAAPAPTLLLSFALANTLWLADVITNLAAQLGAACAVLLAVAILKRRPLAALLLAASVAASLWLLLTPRAPQSTTPATNPIRLLHANVLSSNPRIDEAEAFALSGNHDIVTLMELPRDIGRAIRAGGAASRYPHLLTSGPIKGYSGWVTILSRWPLEPWNEAAAQGRPDDHTGTMCAVAQTPDGPLGIIAIHASSPWAPTRWRIGNAAARHAASVSRAMQARGLPVIVVGDLNATPTGARSRRLAHDAGLSRCKPLSLAVGTFPAWLPWPLRAAIDDAMISSDLSVASWRTLECPGSDHSAIEVELVAPDSPD